MTTRQLLVAAVVVLWTWMLLKPEPVPEFLQRTLLDDVKFVLAKLLHFSMYAFLAWFGAKGLSAPARGWYWSLLLLHGVLTEIGQAVGARYFNTQRTGTWKDVVIDGCGVAAGAWLWLRHSGHRISPSATDRWFWR